MKPAQALVIAIIRSYDGIKRQTWEHLMLDAIAYDFDALFEKYYHELGIPQVYDKVTSILTRIIEVK